MVELPTLRGVLIPMDEKEPINIYHKSPYQYADILGGDPRKYEIKTLGAWLYVNSERRPFRLTVNHRAIDIMFTYAPEWNKIIIGNAILVGFDRGGHGNLSERVVKLLGLE